MSDLKIAAADLPAKPGVYIFKDSAGSVVYVGKAKNLKARIRSYMSGSDTRPLAGMIPQTAEVLSYIVTRSEQDALILENSLIKKEKPRFNIRLRDDKSYLVLKLSASRPFPRVTTGRRLGSSDKGTILGPFPCTKALRRTLELAFGLYKLRTCSNTDFSRRTRPCIRYEIGKCSAPCTGLIDTVSYARNLKKFVSFFKGRKKSVIKDLEVRVKQAAARLEFEKAQGLYEDMKMLQETVSVPRLCLEGFKGKAADICAFELRKGVLYMQWIIVREGGINSIFRVCYEGCVDQEDVTTCFYRWYQGGVELPDVLVAPLSYSSARTLELTLKSSDAKKIRVEEKPPGYARTLLETAYKNLEEAAEKGNEEDYELNDALCALKEMMKLKRIPRSIACFDISVTSGTNPVGSMVWMTDLKPDKRFYRRFNIRGGVYDDDYAMMRETVSRAVRLACAQKRLPDLMVVDGGRAHLDTVAAIPKVRGLLDCLDIAAVCKNRKNSGFDEAVLIDGSRIPLDPGVPCFRSLLQLRDEAHRFALSAHRKRRGKAGMGA